MTLRALLLTGVREGISMSLSHGDRVGELALVDDRAANLGFVQEGALKDGAPQIDTAEVR